MIWLSKSIRSRIVLFIGILSFVVLSGVIAYQYFSTHDFASDNSKRIFELEIKREVLHLEDEFSHLYEDALSLKIAIEAVIQSEELVNSRTFVLELASEFLDKHETTIGIKIVFEPNAFDNDDSSYVGDEKYGDSGQFIPSLSKEYNTLTIAPTSNYELLDFYTLSKESGGSLFTEPYYYDIQGESRLISTVGIPIFNDSGIFIGVIGVSFTLEQIYEYIVEVFNPTFDKRDILVTDQGTIISNSKDPQDSLLHIEKYHPGYVTGFAIVDEFGIKTSTMENGNFEVVLPIRMGETATQWYIFSDVDTDLLFSDSNSITAYMIVIGFIAFAGSLVGLYFIIAFILKPLDLLTHQISQFDPNDITNFKIDVDSKELNEIEILTKAFEDTLFKLKADYEFRYKKDELQTAQIEFRNSIQNTTSLQELSNSIISVLTVQYEAEVGSLYILDSKNTKSNYELHGSYGFKNSKVKSFKAGEGLIGQVAIDKEVKIIYDVQLGDMNIALGIGDIVPENILLIPCVTEDKVVGIIEIGALRTFSRYDREYAESVKLYSGTAIEKVIMNEQTNELLESTRELAEQLTQQQEELRVSNEELESQQEELRVSNEELESQQEELRVSNEELETNLKQVEVFNNELKKAQEDIESRNVEIENANRYKSEFLANMSHELRTPLNSILILSELISENKTISKKAVEYAQTINSSGKDLLELINGILDLSKVESGKELLTIAPWDIQDTVNNMKSIFNPVAVKSKIEFKISIEEDICEINTDETKVKHIVKNLLSNAFKFTKKGHVEFNIFKKGNELFIEVSDTGIGITPESLENIFGAFQQGDGTISREFGGTGLGLSISKHYASLLGGRLVVESILKRGSKFTLILPVDRDSKEIYEGEEIANVSRKIQETQHENGQSDDPIIPDDRHNINEDDSVFLVVDDDANFVKSITELIKNKGHKVIVAETAENALFLADFYLPNAILLDVILPGMSGYEAAEKLKENTRTSNIPVYMISGKEFKKTKAENVIKYFKKPVESKHINQILNDSMEITAGTKKILLAEDNNLQRTALIEYIEGSNNECNIDSVTNGKDALDKLTNNQYDLVILDLALEDVEGFDLIEQIKANDQIKDIPIIVYTGKEFTQEEGTYLDDLVEDIIIKGEESQKRLLDDIKLFIHSFKDKMNLATNNDFEGKTVLVVDDDMRNIFSVSSILETLNINVLFETSALGGIKKLEENPQVNLILMDIMMPEMDGYEAIKRIRKKLKFSKIPIIALTAKTMRGDRQKCIDAGATEYLSKPLNISKLTSMLRVWL